MEFFFFCLVYRILKIFTDYRTVGRDLHNIHTVDGAELFLLRLCGTGHTGFLIIFIKEVLERNICKGLALTFYLYMFLRLNGLMKSVGITTAWHDTSGKFINDKDLIIFYHIILVAEHEVVGTQRQLHIVLDLQVFRIGQILNLEELLYFLDTISGQMHDLIFLVDDEISGLLDLLTHDGIHL